MNEKRIRNIVLAVIAGLLLLNLGIMLSPAVHAVPKTQYIVVRVGLSKCGPSDCFRQELQRTLDQQSAQGWVYVDGGNSDLLIFKK
jgi:hypothetical protein